MSLNVSPNSLKPQKQISLVKGWFAVMVLILGTFLLSIDSTVLFLAIPSLTKELNPSAEQLLWISDIYSLALAGLLIVMGNLADKIGRKKILLIGSAVFAFTSLIAAFSPTADALIMARAVLGVAGAAIMPSTIALIRNIFSDDKNRSLAFALWASAFGAGSAVGPLIGGLLLEHFTWGSVFLMNIPVMVLIILCGSLLLPESKNPNPGHFDILSAFLLLATITPFIYTVKHFAKHGFTPEIWGALAVTFICAVLFAHRAQKQNNPLIDITLFRSSTFTTAVLANMFAVFSIIGVFLFFSQYLQYVRGYSPFWAGVAELPGAAGQILGPLSLGVLTAKLGRRLTVTSAAVTLAAGLLLLAFAETQQAYAWFAIALFVIGFGAAALMTLTLEVILQAAPHEKAGAASAISETSIEIGAVLGIAILGTLVNSLYRAFIELPANITEEAKELLSDSLAQAMPQATTPELVTAVSNAFNQAIHVTSLLSGFIILLLALAIWRYIPNKTSVPQIRSN